MMVIAFKLHIEKLSTLFAARHVLGLRGLGFIAAQVPKGIAT